jgi:3-ketosteroid 9alpha-monooxygenase subunit B
MSDARPPRDRGFHPLRISRVVRETADATSFVLDVPCELRDSFVYEAGQFCTFRATIDGEPYLRSYSMSSAPAVGDDMQVTVKRVPGGIVSNWMNDALGPGDTVEASCPAGVFVLGGNERDIVACAGGSGITPVFSILKTALATSSRRVHLLYANRDRDSVIFGTELDTLAERYRDRLLITHHLDVDQGFVDGDEVRRFGRFVPRAGADPEHYICGPGPFMDIVTAALRACDVPADAIHIERFDPVEPPKPDEVTDAPPPAVQVTVELNGRTATGTYRQGATILQTARQLGLSPPSSCESGNCATCMAKVVEGAATMHANNALTADEVSDGWVLTCQGVPASPSLHVVYDYE